MASQQDNVGPLLAFDMDLFFYETLSANQIDIAVDPSDPRSEVYTSANIGYVLDEVVSRVNQIAEDERFKGKSILPCVSSLKNFRKALYPEYKANRSVRKPTGYSHLVKAFVGEAPSTYAPYGLEADDGLGLTCAYRYDCVMVSWDKDMLTVPGTHYNPHTDELVTVDEETADFNLRCQALSGDSTDNYPGCKGIGVKRAPLHAESWSDMFAAFEKAGHDLAYAVTMVRLARILRNGDYSRYLTMSVGKDIKAPLWESPVEA